MKITYKTTRQTYNETPQKNSLRWILLEEVATGEFINTTNAFMCKDYFNDFVAWKHSKADIEIYGMRANNAKFDTTGGLYVLLTGVQKGLFSNIDNIINVELQKAWGFQLICTPITKKNVIGKRYLNGDVALLYLPNEALASTYRISLVTLFIRNCNKDFTYPDYESLIDRNFYLDGSLNEGTYTLIKERKFAFDLEQKYWWYYNDNYKAGDVIPNASIIHNCGVSGYTQALLEVLGSPSYESAWVFVNKLSTYTPIKAKEIENEVFML